MSSPEINTQPTTTLSKMLPWIVLLLSALGLFYFVENGCGAGSAGSTDKQENQVDTSHTSMPIVDTTKIDSLVKDSLR